MTRKDYELLARVVNGSRSADPIDVGTEWEMALDHVAEALARSLAGTNPNFNHQRFLTACGVKS